MTGLVKKIAARFSNQRKVTAHFILSLSVALFFFSNLTAQVIYPKNDFRSPLDIPLNLSGNFGEMRTNHFHAGIDIKTEQREGLNVYAVADGYVSRIKVSPFGYGYALYLTHPNGYTTVYGHLKQYADKIDSYVKKQQYKLESFSIDIYPDSAELPVLKGEIIALSGNSGGSGGPHLHFEVRETVSEKVLNPLNFGYDIKDDVKPTIGGIWIVPLGDSASVNGVQRPVNLKMKTYSGNCALANPKPATVYGDIGFAVHTTDLLSGNSNRCGIYRIELFVDGIQVYGQQMDKLDFSTNRAMNAHTIYEQFKKNKSSIHNSYRLPGNPLDIYDNLLNDGVLSFKDGKLHDCEYRIFDFKGNKSTLNFQVQSLSDANGKVKSEKNAIAHWNWEEDNTYEGEEVKIGMKSFTLYEDFELTIEKSSKITAALTPTYLIGSVYTPVHSNYRLSLKVDNPPAGKTDKLTVVRWDPDHDRIYSEGGNFADGWITASPKDLGYFSVKVDTVRPEIKNLDLNASMKGRTQFSFRISDALSGINQIIPTIDGNWALMEYDAKFNRLTYYFDSRYINKGKHKFELTVIDAVGNESKYSREFEW